MKIGTLTFHRASNYGGALQCYALIHYLRSKGYDAEVIDYRSKAIEDSYRLLKFDSLRSLLSSFIHFKEHLSSNTFFETFRKNYLTISQQSYYSATTIGSNYDLILIGSDQVWSKRINKGFDKVFWGNIPGGAKIVSYAASMGTDHSFTSDEYNLISGYLKNFWKISTREDSLRDELSNLTAQPISSVADPTLLLSKEDYAKIASFPAIENYVLYYQMEYNPESKYRVIEVARQLGSSIVVIGGKKEYYSKDIFVKHYKTVSPSQFVGYILRARCVFASSFHGTALSLAMNKDFYFFANYETDRAENLLRHVSAIDRMVSSSNPLHFTTVDYGKVNEALQKYKTISINFLDTVLKDSMIE